MPHEIPLSAGDAAGMFAPSLGHNILGPSSSDRATKTFLPAVAGLESDLSLIQNHAKKLRRYAALVGSEECDLADLWEDWHLSFIEHFASRDGFSLKVIARAESLKAAAEQILRETGATGADNGQPQR